MKKLILFLLCLFSPLAFAVVVNCDLSWNAPTERDDEYRTPIQEHEIIGYRIYTGVDAIVDMTGPFTSIDSGKSGVVTLDLAPRLAPYTLNFGVTAVDVDGVESLLSQILTQDVLVSSTAAPSPPTNLRFSLTCADGKCEIQ